MNRRINRRRRPNKRQRGLRRLHYLIGLGVLVPLLLLSITGIVINHGPSWSLDQRYLGPRLADLFYGVTPEAPDQGYRLEGDGAEPRLWVSHARDQLFFNSTAVGHLPRPPVGVAQAGEFVAVASSDQLLLFTRAGALVENVTLPANLSPVARLSGGSTLIIDTPVGRRYSPPPWLAWTEVAPTEVSGQSQPPLPATALPDPLKQTIATQLAGQTVTWQRFMLDLHSGRILGAAGPWLLDLVAIVTILLAITGCLLWWRLPSARPSR